MKIAMTRCLVSLLLLMFLAVVASAAEVVFLDGKKLEGKVISKDATTLKLEVTVDGKTSTRIIALNTVHSVTINDKRYLINEKQDGTSGGTNNENGDPSANRTRAEVVALIAKVGKEPPDWFAETALNYPKTLDLSWEQPPQGQWNNQKNVGQYIWDVINPNPNKWREGIRLLHHLLVLHKDDPDKRERAMLDLGWMYHNLHQDYARAAFWWEKAEVPKSGGARLCVHLAGCYYRLGNKEMAMELLSQQRVTVVGIKLLADMGDLAEAVQMVQQYPPTADSGAVEAYLYIADGTRQAGQLQEALQWYEKALAIPRPEKVDAGLKRNLEQAQNAIAAIKLFDLFDPKKIADGTYEQEAQGYEGAVRVSVTVKSGRIEQVRVVEHREKQFYSALKDTPRKIISKQGVKGVDATSNATITSNAIINASAKALASGSK